MPVDRFSKKNDTAAPPHDSGSGCAATLQAAAPCDRIQCITGSSVTTWQRGLCSPAHPPTKRDAPRSPSGYVVVYARLVVSESVGQARLPGTGCVWQARPPGNPKPGSRLRNREPPRRVTSRPACPSRPFCVHAFRRVLTRRRRVSSAKCRHWGPTRGIDERRICRLAGVFLEAAAGVEPAIKVLQT
jgi:hypothetical protein